MVHPNSILSIIPPPELDNLINDYNPEIVNVYVDLKNASVALYVKEIIFEILQNSEKMIDSSIFQSIVIYSAFWKEYGIRKNKKVNIYFCTDKGESLYHINIDKKYKENRKIGDVDLANYYDQFTEIRRKNFELAEKVCNKIPNVYFLLLKFLESDFLPYYLITRKFNDKKYFHIIISNDKDMFQTLIQENIVMVHKFHGISYLLNRNAALRKFMGLDKEIMGKKAEERFKFINNLDINYLSAMQAIIGDMGDNVKGIKGMGPAKLFELFKDINEVKSVLGEFQELVTRIVDNDGDFVNSSDNILSSNKKLWAKILEENITVKKAFKLVSFEALSHWLDNNLTLQQGEYLRYINSILNKEEFKPSVIPKEILINGLNKIINELYINNDHLELLYS